MLRARRKVLSIVLYPSLRAPIAIGISKVKDEEEVVQTKFTHSPTASEHHPRPKVAGLLGTTRLTPRRRLTGRWRAPARPSKLQ